MKSPVPAAPWLPSWSGCSWPSAGRPAHPPPPQSCQSGGFVCLCVCYLQIVCLCVSYHRIVCRCLCYCVFGYCAACPCFAVICRVCLICSQSRFVCVIVCPCVCQVVYVFVWSSVCQIVHHQLSFWRQRFSIFHSFWTQKLPLKR